MADHLADALNTIKTHEHVGLTTCRVRGTKLIGQILRLLKEHRYLKGYELVEDGRGGHFQIELEGRINDCGVIKPRASVRRSELASKEQQYIPGFGVGLLILSTPGGVMTNMEAEKNRLGGRLLAYIY